MALKIGVVGTGFARSFIPLFKAHPLVGEVMLAECLPERLRDTAR
ncbi:MAG: gfo/Idh/MocA family oxidoreductase, partial [Candidatus Latescibacteria bacterium]|nr:gfo/Idh/MocA family oxidoreductase [Candidatus Latescibacterota bacterium]